MRIVKLTFLIIGFVFAMTVVSYSQTTECPANLVCISREVALKALADADKLKAIEAESLVKDKAIADYKDLLNDAKVKIAELSGENTELRQNRVSDRAIIEALLKNSRPKKIGLINIW